MNELLRQLWAAQNRIERPAGGDASTVYMHGVIADETLQEEYLKYFDDKRTISAASVLKQLGEVSSETVLLHINSPGGSYFEGAAIRDVLMADGRSMVSIGAGMVGSAATLPFLAANTRQLSDGGLFFVHEPSSFVAAFGMADELEKEVGVVSRGLRAITNATAALYSSATGGKVSAKRFLDYMEKETMFTPQEALDLGLVHQVITPESEPTAKEVDVDKATMARAMGLPEDVSDADLEEAVKAMKSRDDASQKHRAEQSAESVFDAAMAVPLAQGKITPAGVEQLKRDYLAAENKEAFLSVQKATLQALSPNSSFNATTLGSGSDPTGQQGDPDTPAGAEDDVVKRVQARIDAHQKAGMSVLQSMNAARAENPTEFDQYRYTDISVKEFHTKGVS